MAAAVQYEYMDSTIDEGLKCSICLQPLFDPLCTSCRHAFCRRCFKNQITAKSACPECAKPLSSKDILPMVLLVCRMLDDLMVRCVGCGQIGIKRGQFNRHLAEVCPKALVNCSAVDIRCPWQGRANALSLHQASCVYEQLREVLSKLIAENNELRNDNSLRQTANTTVHSDSNNASAGLAPHTATIEQQTTEVNILQDIICHRHEQLEVSIGTCPTGSSIDLRQQKLTDLDMGIVIQRAIIDRQCTELQLQANTITDTAVSLLARSLRKNLTLTKLNLSHNAISDLGVHSLAQLLATNDTRIDRLYICHTGITDQGAHYLADMLKTNTTLVSLGLFKNRLTDRGILAIFDALATHNKVLKNLYFDSNSLVTDGSVDGCIHMLNRNHVLGLIDMERCGLSAAGKKRLREAASKRPNFTLAL